jgi:hypothetical protein
MGAGSESKLKGILLAFKEYPVDRPHLFAGGAAKPAINLQSPVSG